MILIPGFICQCLIVIVSLGGDISANLVFLERFLKDSIGFRSHFLIELLETSLSLSTLIFCGSIQTFKFRLNFILL